MSNENQNQNRKPSVPHLPATQLRGKPIGLKLTTTKEGTPQEKEALAVQFTIADGEHAGKTIGKLLFFTDDTIDITLKAMRAMGWQGVDPTNFDGMDKDVMLVIEHEVDTQNGGKRANVRWVNSIGLNVKPLEGSKLAAFKQRVGGYAARQQGSNGAQTGKLPPMANGETPPPSDSDAPPWMRG